MNRSFAVTLTVGVVLTLLGYSLLAYQDNHYYAPYHNPNLGPNDQVNLSFIPPPSDSTFINPISVNAVLFPLVNRTETSLLHLSVAANFNNTSQISFLFESSFHIAATNRNSSSGNGVGVWKIFPWSTSTGEPETMVQLLYNSTETTRQPLTFNADIYLSFTGLPFLYDHGRYTILFPFDSSLNQTPVDEGFFDVCIPQGFLFSGSNVPQAIEPAVCSGAGESIQSRLNQSSALTVTYDDPQTEQTYSNYQTYGLFSVGVGVPAIISSIALYTRSASGERDLHPQEK